MGLFDSVTSAVNRGNESAGRAVEKVKINNKLNEITKRRQQLTSQLGASLYLATKDNAAMREGREELYNAIAACDTEREQCQQRLGQIETMIDAAEWFRCAVCGAKMTGADLFCSGCGTAASQARPVVVNPSMATMTAPMSSMGVAKCASCGAPMNVGDVFCMSCGASASTADSSVQAPRGPKCASCGAPMSEGDVFCMTCGSSAVSTSASSSDVAQAATDSKCASCGAPLNTGDVFCMGCGAKVVVEQASSSASASLGASAVVEESNTLSNLKGTESNDSL